MGSKEPNPPPKNRTPGPKVASPPPPPKRGQTINVTHKVEQQDSGSDALNCLRLVNEVYKEPLALMPSQIDSSTRWQVVQIDASQIVGFGGTPMAAVLDAHKHYQWSRMHSETARETTND